MERRWSNLRRRAHCSNGGSIGAAGEQLQRQRVLDGQWRQQAGAAEAILRAAPEVAAAAVAAPETADAMRSRSSSSSGRGRGLPQLQGGGRGKQWRWR